MYLLALALPISGFSTLFKNAPLQVPGQRAPQRGLCSPGPEPLRFSPRQVSQVWVIVALGWSNWVICSGGWACLIYSLIITKVVWQI
jgi:hypothetical protein